MSLSSTIIFEDDFDAGGAGGGGVFGGGTRLGDLVPVFIALLVLFDDEVVSGVDETCC